MEYFQSEANESHSRGHWNLETLVLAEQVVEFAG